MKYVILETNHISVGENPVMVNQFVRVHGNYPTTDFRAPNWVHSAQKPWWRDLMLYVLKHFHADLKKLGLCETVRATCYGIDISVPNFFAIFELYCPASGTFFTPIGELGMELHSMWKVSNLPMGSLPYEKNFPCAMELEQLEKDDPALFETY